MTNISITGIGISSAIGQGKEQFVENLFKGSHAFQIMQREGRQHDSAFIGAEIASPTLPHKLIENNLGSASLSGLLTITTLEEAWGDAKLDDVDPERIGLIIGGSNLQQRDTLLTYQRYLHKPFFTTPTHAVSFSDTYLSSLCTDYFGIHGPSYTIGAASASGQLAVIQALQAVQSGQVDVCIALAGLMDLSYIECQSFRNLGAMGSDRFANEPALACRPFDSQHDGFIYGEACAAVVVEREAFAHKRQNSSYASISGHATFLGASKLPTPTIEAERTVIMSALDNANMTNEDIDYINPHGSGSIIGDDIELKALQSCNLSHAKINTTKSITGHSLTAAGGVEIVATLLQMQQSLLHPSRNLIEPINNDFNWVMGETVKHQIENALCLSYGFGGIYTAICLSSEHQ